MGALLYTLAAILVVIWLVGLIAKVTFGAIHLLLVVAAILIIWNLLTNRRSMA